MLILKVLLLGRAHGLQIAQAIERRSDDVLLVEQGSLYPALYRLEERGWITSSWDIAESKRRARFYKLTRTGRLKFTSEASRWDRLTHAVARVMRPSDAER